MSCIRFKFKSSLEFDQVRFDGLQITVAELREKIMNQKKLGSSNEFTLEIMDSGTSKMYSDDTEMIPRNTSVIVKRVPKPQQNKLPKTYHKDLTLPQADVKSLTKDELGKTTDLAGADASEEDKVEAMMIQAGLDYNPSNYAQFRGSRGRGMATRPPLNYVCHRCGKKGHWIKYCPTNGDPLFNSIRLNHSTNIPNTHLTPVTSTNLPGAMLDRSGRLVIRKVDLNAVTDSVGKSKIAVPAIPEVVKVPDELNCGICKELVRDAVVIPCCGSSFCDECIRDYLLENDFQCFSCKEMDVSPDTLVPNKTVRASAKNFQNQIAEKQSIAVARGYQPLSLPPSHTTSSRLLASERFSLGKSTKPDEKVVANSVVNHTHSEKPQAFSDAKGGSKVTCGGSQDKDGDKVAVGRESSQDGSKSVSSPLRVTRNVSPVKVVSATTSESSKTSSSPSTSVTVTTAITCPITVSPSSTMSTTLSSRRRLPLSSSILAPPPLPPVLHPPNPISLLPAIAAATAGGGLMQPTQPILPQLPPALPMPPPPPPALFVQPAPQPAKNPLASSQPPLDAMSIVRLTELLAAAERSTQEKRGSSSERVSSPPLSMKEFYQHQKLLLKKSKRSRHSFSPSPSCSSSSYSDSFDSYSYSSSSPSRSPSRSRSRSPLYHRSRSRSPYPKVKSTHHAHKSRRAATPPRRRRHLTDRSEKSRRRQRDRGIEVVDSHSRRLKKHKHHHRHWREEAVGSRMAVSQRLSPALEPMISVKKSRSRSHQDQKLYITHSKHRHGKRRRKIPSCPPSEIEEGEAGGSVKEKSVSTQRIVEIYNMPPSEDESPYPALPSAVLEGSAGSPGVSCSTRSSTSMGDLRQSTLDATGDSQTTSKSEREPAETPPLSSKNTTVTLEEKAKEEVLDHTVKEDMATEDRIELEAEDHLMEEEMESSTVIQQEEEDSQDLDETRGTEDGDLHGPVLASTVHKVDSEYHNSVTTLPLPTSTRKKSRHKEHKHKSHEHKHHYHHQHKEHSRQEKHERRKKQHQPPPERAHSIHERKHSSIKKKKRKHSSSHRD